MKKQILVGVIGFLVILLAATGYFYFNNKQTPKEINNNQPEKQVQDNKIDQNQNLDLDEQKVVQDQLLTEELEKKIEQESDSTDPNDIEKTLDDINLDEELGDLDSLDI